MTDKEIDFTDIPETADWSRAVVGKFYRPVKDSLVGGAPKKRQKLQSKKSLRPESVSRDTSRHACRLFSNAATLSHAKFGPHYSC